MNNSPTPSMFTPVSKVVKSNYLTIAVYGETDTRRTSFAVGTAPEPVFYFCQRAENYEKGLDHYKDRDINVFLFGGTRPLDATAEETAEWALGEREEFAKAYKQAVQVLTTTGQGGTMVWDKGKDARDLLVLSFFGDYTPDKLYAELIARGEKPNKHRGASWGPVEAVWNSWISQSRAHDKYNMIYVEVSGDEYKNGQSTQRQVIKPGKQIDVICQGHVHLTRKDVHASGSKEPTYYGAITKPRGLYAKVGEVQDLDFDVVRHYILEED